MIIIFTSKANRANSAVHGPSNGRRAAEKRASRAVHCRRVDSAVQRRRSACSGSSVVAGRLSGGWPICVREIYMVIKFDMFNTIFNIYLIFIY